MIALICVFGFAFGFRVVVVEKILPLLPPILWPGGIGIGKDDSVTTTTIETIEKDKQGKPVKTVTTTAHNDGKTLWDWLSLLGVPLSLAILGYFLQEQQRKRADDETKEEVLQNYLDRLSLLLIDKNLIWLLSKSNSRTITPEEQEIVESSLKLIQTRTLSILRRFENDTERKTNVIKFLIETEIVGKSKLKLLDAELEEAELQRANLQGANLQEAYLKKAYLQEANLQEANLQKANLQGAILEGANLQKANLEGANLQGAYLQGANLKEIIWDSETTWPDKSAFISAKNIPEDLKKELGITP